MKKKIFYLIGAAVLLFLIFLAYQANQPVQPETTKDWTAMIDRRELKRETFFVENADLLLEGEVLSPVGGSPTKPAVIFIPGSGSTTYQAYAPGLIEKYVLDVFIPRDYAVVFMNKRGMGLSEGNWMKNDFSGRAEDVMAAVDHLRKLPGIDESRIGVIGHSQGGWVANLVASRDSSLHFFISLAGPVTSVQEQMADIYRNDFRCQGFDGEKLTSKTNRQLTLARIGATIGKVLPIGVIGFDAGIIDYDPHNILLETTNPGLFVYGENDPYVPADQNIKRFKEIFPDGSPHLSVIAVSEGDHHFRKTHSVCQPYEERLKMPFSENLLAQLNTWLDQQDF